VAEPAVGLECAVARLALVAHLKLRLLGGQPHEPGHQGGGQPGKEKKEINPPLWHTPVCNWGASERYLLRGPSKSVLPLEYVRKPIWKHCTMVLLNCRVMGTVQCYIGAVQNCVVSLSPKVSYFMYSTAP